MSAAYQHPTDVQLACQGRSQGIEGWDSNKQSTRACTVVPCFPLCHVWFFGVAGNCNRLTALGGIIYVKGNLLKNIKDGYNFIDRMSGEKVKLVSPDGTLTPATFNYTITHKDGTVKEFTNKRLTKITIGNDNASTKSNLSKGVRGTLINTITDGVGRVYQINRTRGKMTYVSYKGTGDTALRQITYSYVYSVDYSSGCLSKITYPGGLSVNYKWTDGNLTKITDGDGYSVNYEYTNGKVTKITETAFDGTIGESITIAYGSKSTVYTDIQGHQEIINFDN